MINKLQYMEHNDRKLPSPTSICFIISFQLLLHKGLDTYAKSLQRRIISSALKTDIKMALKILE